MTNSNGQASPAPLRLAVLLLAAGQGSRLGGVPKGLLRRKGKTLLNYFCQAVQLFNPVEFVVVTGFYQDAIAKEMSVIGLESGLRFSLIHNSQASTGQASSVRLGIESLQSDYDVLLIALSDQSEIVYEDLLVLVDQFKDRNAGAEIILPVVEGHRGNPVVFSRKVIQDILKVPSLSCRAFIDAHPELVQTMETSRLAYIQDVDTPDDLNRFCLEIS